MNKKTIHFSFGNLNPLEGGVSRNKALKTYLAPYFASNHILASNHFSRLLTMILISCNWGLIKESICFIHYSSIPYIYTEKLSTSPIFVKYFLSHILRKFDRSNNIFVEVNDLPYYQAKDLELAPNNLDILDDLVFSLEKAHFVFASNAMREFIVYKYGISRDRTSVLLNGGISNQNTLAEKVNHKKSNNKLNLKKVSAVYAGTLNKGRNIEEMINEFRNSKYFHLYLVGDGGDWIVAESLTSANIHYLGSMPEQDAYNFAAECDIGLIPYNSDRFYYNLCFPTKASFYICAGIPILSTGLYELRATFTDDVSFFCPLDEWLRSYDHSEILDVINQKKINAISVSNKFTWVSIIDDWCKNHLNFN